MSKITVNGFDLNYRQVGEGEDVVFIHGLAANHAFWRFQLLMALARDYRVTTYDLRGHGYSDMPLSGYSTADMASDLVVLLDHLGIERAHLVGHSYGGVVALHAAVLHPRRVRSLTIQDSRIRALQPRQRLIDWPDWRVAKARLQELGIEIDENEEEIGVKLLEKLASLEWRADAERQEKRPLFIPFTGWAAGHRSASRWLKLLATTSAREDIQETAGLTLEALATVAAPTLAIYGEHSRCLKTFEELPGVLGDCTNYIMKDVGHFYPVIKPVEVSELLLDFFAGLKKRAAPTEKGSLPPLFRERTCEGRLSESADPASL